MRNKNSLFGALACASMFAATSATATSLEKMEFKEMVQEATACVVARTVSVDYDMADGAPVTKTTFEVSRTAFGSTADRITVTTPGGRIAGATVAMGEVNAGAPRFFGGSESLLLLNRHGNGEYGVVGYAQGVFNIVETAAGDAVSLPQSQGGLTPVDEAMALIGDVRASAVVGPVQE